MTIDQWLQNAREQFERANIPSARLDAEVLLCHILGVDRAYLVAHGDESLARIALNHKGGVHPGGVTTYGERLVLDRLKRKPIAYLLGHKEFYGRDFIVNRHVLIPRPETEALIELAKKHHLTGQILDVGTGSGAIGLTLWYELDDVTVTLSDVSEDALAVAEKNAKSLRAKAVSFVESDLLEHWADTETSFDAIVANLPYVDKSWDRSPETGHEPHQALFARDGGLELIKLLIDQARSLISPRGYLLLESDPQQQESIVAHAKSQFEEVEHFDYGLLLRRI